jgi:hypothetical protein
MRQKSDSPSRHENRQTTQWCFARTSAEALAGPGIIAPTGDSDLFRGCLKNGVRVIEPMMLMISGLKKALHS